MFAAGKAVLLKCGSLRSLRRLPSRFRCYYPSSSTHVGYWKNSFSTAASTDHHLDTTIGDEVSSVKMNNNSAHHASLAENGKTVTIHFVGDNDDEARFHTSWLWAMDPNFIHPTSGQRLRPLASQFGYQILSVSIGNAEEELSPRPSPGCYHSTGVVYQTPGRQTDEDNDNTKTRPLLNVTWKAENGDEYVSSYDVEWLRSRRYDQNALNQRAASTQITPQSALSQHRDLTEMEHAILEEDPETARFQILDTLFRDGAVLLKGATPNMDDLDSTVGKLAMTLAQRISHGHLYGDIFHVQHKPNANNIAYTTSPLAAHQDLAYYTSKPGLQLLHCVNNKGTTGGESLLVDGMAAATALGHLAPDLYQILLECEATFLKQRGDADMVFRRPHIEQDATGIVTAVHWSPPFEGPLAIEEGKVDDYYVAYTAFERMVNVFLPHEQYLLPRISNELEQQLIDYSREFTLERKLDQGDILIFNNQRMLHGRRSFAVQKDSPANGRHLVGCYTDLDETMNQYRLLRRAHLKELGSPEYIRNSGNGSSSIC